MHGHLRQRHGIEQQRIGPNWQAGRRERAGQQRGLENVDSVDQLGPHEGDRPGERVSPYLKVEPASNLGLEQLGIAQTVRLPVGRRMTAAAATGPARQPRPTSSIPATWR